MKELFSKTLTFDPNFNMYFFPQPLWLRNKKTYSKFNLFHILEFMYLLHCIESVVYYRKNYTKKILGMTTYIITVDYELCQILFGHM